MQNFIEMKMQIKIKIISRIRGRIKNANKSSSSSYILIDSWCLFYRQLSLYLICLAIFWLEVLLLSFFDLAIGFLLLSWLWFCHSFYMLISFIFLFLNHWIISSILLLFQISSFLVLCFLYLHVSALVSVIIVICLF